MHSQCKFMDNEMIEDTINTLWSIPGAINFVSSSKTYEQSSCVVLKDRIGQWGDWQAGIQDRKVRVACVLKTTEL